MANPIKASDLYEDDGAIQRAIKQLNDLGEAINAIQKDAAKLTVTVKAQNATNAKQRDEIGKVARQADELAKEQQKLTHAYSETNQEIQRLRLERNKANQIAKAEARLAESVAGSYDALSAQYTLNKIRLNEMSAEQRATTQAGRELEAATNGIYQEMKQLQEATGKTALNVGNYKEGVKGAIQETLGLDRAMAMLSKTPVLAVISLVVMALGALFQAFTRSEKGAQMMAKASGALEGIMSLLVKVADNVATVLVKIWEDPVQGVKDLWAAIQENLVNRFKGLIALFGAVGSSLQAMFKGDLPALKKAAEEAATAFIQLQTGMDPEKQKEYADALKASAKAMADIRVARLETIKQNRVLIRQTEALATAEQVAQVVADDATKSFAEREAAAERAREALERRAALEVKVAQNNLDLIEREIAIRKGNNEAAEAQLDQQLSAFQALAAAQREYTVTVATNEKVRAQLVQDRLERDLDILIDGFDNVKTINERIIADETETLGRRRAILNETVRLSNESFARQIATIQEFTGVAVDANALIAESDSIALNEKIRALGLSEIIEGRLLEVIRDRRLATDDLTRAQKELTAATKESLTVAQALSSTIQTQALKAQAAQASEVVAIATKVAEQSKAIGTGAEIGAAGIESLKSAFGTAKQQLSEYFSQAERLASFQLQQAQQGVQAAQNELQIQLQLAAAGYASRVEAAQDELALARQTQAEAERQRQRAQRAQLVAQSVEQASNLVTAISKLFAELPFFLALPASAVLFGTFAAAKVKAFQATRIFKEGGYEVLEGGSHSSGRDIPLGFDSKGRQRRAEGGEGMAIFSRKATARYGGMLPNLVAAINRGEFERKYAALTHAADSLAPGTAIVNVDTGGVESRLDALRRDGQRRTWQDGKGRTVEQIGNRKITYV